MTIPKKSNNEVTIEELEKLAKTSYGWARLNAYREKILILNPEVGIDIYKWGDGGGMDCWVTERRRYRFIWAGRKCQWLRWRNNCQQWIPQLYAIRWWKQQDEKRPKRNYDPQRQALRAYWKRKREQISRERAFEEDLRRDSVLEPQGDGAVEGVAEVEGAGSDEQDGASPDAIPTDGWDQVR